VTVVPVGSVPGSAASPDAPGGIPGAPHLLEGELACPRCGNGALEAVFDGQETNFLCRACWTCWHYNLGWMEPVPPSTCPGCREEACRRDDAPGTDTPDADARRR
jgi:hypothetical protein